MNNPLNNSLSDETVPVLVVGGSLVGLSFSLFLARQGIKPLVVERHPGTAIHPRVSSLTARTMKITVWPVSRRIFAVRNLLFLENLASCLWRAWPGKCLII
ncbi:hypothetical protein DMN77_09605 [Paenibacillus sp. 79R4]|nr:hypothetical protein [Paenibacillus sp. 79R4]